MRTRYRRLQLRTRKQPMTPTIRRRSFSTTRKTATRIHRSSKVRTSSTPRPKRAKPEGRHVPERIQKILANAGIGSRRSIERWVAAGRITVNGRIAKLGEQLQGRERVCLDGKPVRLTATAHARQNAALL